MHLYIQCLCVYMHSIFIVSQAYYRGYFGPKYVYIMPSFYNEGWWASSSNASCSDGVLKEVLNGSLTVIAAGYLINEDDATAMALSRMVYGKDRYTNSENLKSLY